MERKGCFENTVFGLVHAVRGFLSVIPFFTTILPFSLFVRARLGPLCVCYGV